MGPDTSEEVKASNSLLHTGGGLDLVQKTLLKKEINKDEYDGVSIFDDDAEWSPGSPASSSTIWRYMGFTQFSSLLEREQLWFSNIQEFRDPYEGTIPKKNAEQNSDILVEILEDMFEDRDEIEIDADELGIIELATKPPFDGYVNCWTLNDHQSVALWEQYLEGPQGIAIKTTVDKLKNSINDSEKVINGGKVNYIDYESNEIPEGRLPILYHKRRSFEHEEEYRLSFLRDEDDEMSSKGEYIDVDLDTLIEEVYLSPRSTDWYHELVQEVARTYGLDCKINESGLYTEPVY